MFDSLSNKFPKASYCIIALLISIHCFGLSHSFAANLDSREYRLKAGYIYNFTKFIKWPEKANREIKYNGLKFCIVGEDPFGSILDIFSGKLEKKNGPLIVIPRVPIKDMRQCHILFVSGSEKSNVNQILLRVREYPVLVIGDTPGFAERGVGVNFYLQKNKIRFEMNREALKRAGIVVSSELLNLARIVAGRKMR